MPNLPVSNLSWKKVFLKALSRGAYALAGALVPILTTANSLSEINWDRQLPAMLGAALLAAGVGGGNNWRKHRND